jgi:hypothetical protein
VIGAAEPDSDGANAQAPEPHISEIAPSINADVRSAEESEDEFGFKAPNSKLHSHDSVETPTKAALISKEEEK